MVVDSRFQRPTARWFGSGGRPACALLSLLRQRKKAKKGDPASPVAAQLPSVWATGRASAELARPTAGLRQAAADFPRPVSRPSAAQRAKGARCSEVSRYLNPFVCHDFSPKRVVMHPLPSEPPSTADRSGGVRGVCLSPAAGRASLRTGHAGRGAQGTRKGGEVGSPFFASFLWRDKERKVPAGHPPHLNAAPQALNLESLHLRTKKMLSFFAPCSEVAWERGESCPQITHWMALKPRVDGNWYTHLPNH